MGAVSLNNLWRIEDHDDDFDGKLVSYLLCQVIDTLAGVIDDMDTYDQSISINL